MKKDYLSSIPLQRFAQIIPRRRGIIESAPATMPQYEYNANVLAKNLHPSVQHVIVTDIVQLHNAKLYTLSPNAEKGTEKLAYFQPGQYISLDLRISDSRLTRPYSLCSLPSVKEYQIVVKDMKNGFASEYINNSFEIGTEVDISEPSGFFCYEPLRDAPHIVGIAGGSGIAPFLSMAKAIAEGILDAEMTLLYGSRTEEEILFKEELDALEKKCEQIKVVHVLSDEKKEGYYHGFISKELIRKYMKEDSSVFVCGSQGMYDYIRTQTEEMLLPLRRVRFDAYGEYRLSARDEEKAVQGKQFELRVITNDGETHVIPAGSDESILVAIERAGIKAPSKCRSGECGWCRMKLVCGEVYTPSLTEHRRQYDQEAGYLHACCSFPLSDCTIAINCE
ncbi:MAG: iron-sulfur cluster-binding domain-containing protein [Erysipelotrichaceae bacterium]|nr:iron-sulfur cluster-binding domain-containing protein [Erysipelotrichaceae bacterium]